MILNSSFGFGGANVHAILESYEPNVIVSPPGTFSKVAVFTPFVFSAFSEASLLSVLEKYQEYLQNHSDTINLRDLAYTLHSRRTSFQFTSTVVASSVEDLSRNIAKYKNNDKDSDKPPITRVPRWNTSQSGGPRLLGVFVCASPSKQGWNKPDTH